jgi:hypothetical protein
MLRGDMDRFREYAVQAALAAFQCAVIQVGTLAATVLIRAAGYPDETRDWPWLPAWIREWGPAAFAIPLAWVVATIVLEQSRPDRFSKRSTFFSGLLLGLALAAVYAIACRQAAALLP